MRPFILTCQQLERIATINSEGVISCLEYYNEDRNDAKAIQMLSESLAYAMAQFRLLR